MVAKPEIIKSIEKAIDYISACLEEDNFPILEGAAKASGLSKYHFHRIFKLVSGETFADMVTRLRLAKGLGTLASEKTSITQAAMAAGYGSSQAFAKAVKRETEMTATDIKNEPDRLAAIYQTLSSSPKNTGPLRVGICTLDPFALIVTETTDKYPALNEVYGELFETMGDPSNIVGVLGIPHRDIETFEGKDFTFDCGLAVQKTPSDFGPNMSVKKLSEGIYLTIRHRGLDRTLPSTLDVLYKTALEQTNLVISDSPCLFHYIDDPEEVEEAHCRTDIYLKVET
ncbi:AraC family transcriptional regulator [Litorimonas haliclonae]|uniref:AraC family transcriptional regulator n=1 Tax=Litorimonas haliclonae TaxID=2081977 RepID=UPI0039EFC68E